MDLSETTGMEEAQFIDVDTGLPAELNQLKTAELLQAVQSYSGLAFLNEEQYDPLGSDEANRIIVESYHLSELPAQELPNSTMPPAPLPTGPHPCLEDFEGEFGFTICTDALNATGMSNSWAYSETLRQVFIKMNNVLVVQFKTSRPLDSDRFYIRALLVYQNNDYMNQAVSRCSIHWMEDDPSQLAHRTPKFCECTNYNLAGHVLRCHSEGAHYQFDSNSDRHSVLVEVPRTPEAGSDFIKAVHYFFSCKTSCPRGMQRRAVQLIFTLEDTQFQVYGRKVLPVKICSCPKRDKDRQERDFKAEDVAERKGTKRPMVLVDQDVKPTKIEREAALYNLQLRHATRESLETALIDLVTKQARDMEEYKLLEAKRAVLDSNRESLMKAMDTRLKTMNEIVRQFPASKDKL